MLETALNVAWMMIAAGVFAATLRCTPRVRIALLCAVVLLFPIISISDDFIDTTFNDTAALAVVFVMAMLLVAVARVRRLEVAGTAFAFATPSDPRSPPRA